MASVIIRRPKANVSGASNAGQTEPRAVAERKVFGVYMRSLLDTKVTLAITEIGKNVKPNLEAKVISKIAGKCISEGFIKPNSIKIINYSCGMVMSEHIEFHVVFECMICLPVEGMLIECVTKTITKAGVHAQVIDDEGNIPVTIFVARDHHHMDNRFNNIKEGSKITVRIIGIRYELNDAFICAIAKLTDTSTNEAMRPQTKSRIRLIGGEDIDMVHGGDLSDEGEL